MEDQKSSEASQGDPIVMYLIIRESLNMSAGKIAVQCSHATQMLSFDYFGKCAKYVNDTINDEFVIEQVPATIQIFREWLNSYYRKVTVRASDKEWNKIKEEYKDQMALVVDLGLTEIPNGSETVIGLWPMRKSQRTKTLKRLQKL